MRHKTLVLEQAHGLDARETDAMTGLWMVSYIALWLVSAMLVLGMIALARQVGLLHRRLPPMGARTGDPGPAIGEAAPVFAAPDLKGRLVEVGGRRDRSTLLVFVSLGCEACERVAPA